MTGSLLLAVSAHIPNGKSHLSGWVVWLIVIAVIVLVIAVAGLIGRRQR
jgi:hypothetical protein